MQWRLIFPGANMAAEEIQATKNEKKASGTIDPKPFSKSLIISAQMIGDGLILGSSSYFSLVFAIYPHQIWQRSFCIYALMTAITMIFVVARLVKYGVYYVFDEFKSMEIIKITLKCLLKAILLLTACLFAFKVGDAVSRIWLATWGITGAVALCGFRLCTGSAARRLREIGRLTRNVAIVAASEVGHQLATKLIYEYAGTRLVGIFDERQSRFIESGRDRPRVRQLPALYELLCRGRVDEIVIAIPPHASQRILELSQRFHPFPVALRVLAPDGYENFQVLDSRRYGEIGTFRVLDKPLDEVAALVKRIEDVVIAAFCLLLTLPLMLVIALAIKLDSRGPVLFKQKRLGANNLPFELLKFRSMFVEQTDSLGHQLTCAGDPRVTRIGRLLRVTSMDELPQLINVLKGEMSLVGPRPHALAASAAGIAYARAISEYPIRHRVKPGITGWAQVNGWRGETTTIEQIRRRVEHDLYYIENWSLTFDLLILGRTLLAVLSRANAV
jgi:Undecaprenyl-phosphate glucose phosphotransferase